MVKIVSWPLPVQKQLEKIYQYILLNSHQNAEKVKTAILDSTRKLPVHPEMHPPDRYRKNNDGSFRAYEIHRYRITYRITDKAIIIVRVRHTSMEPREY
jgi:plasmid stabilization system protein ParE